MEKFSKINEETELSGQYAFDIFLNIINDFDLLFIKHKYLNTGDYSYFFTTEKITDNHKIINKLERKKSLKHAFLTLKSIVDMRLSFYFGIKRKTLFYGFFNEDTNYVYKVGTFGVTNSYLRKLENRAFKNIRKVLIDADLKKMNTLHQMKSDFEDFFVDFDGKIEIKKEFRVEKVFPTNIFKSEDLNEFRLEYTLKEWGRKYKWFWDTYNYVYVTDKKVYFYIKIKKNK